MNLPIFAFSVGNYSTNLIIKGFENGDYNTKRVKFNLIRRDTSDGISTEEVVTTIKYPYRTLTIKDAGYYKIVPISGKLSVLQTQFGFATKRNSDTPKYLEGYLEQTTCISQNHRPRRPNRR